MTKKANDHDQIQAEGASVKTKLSAIANDIKAFRAKLDQGGLSAEDKSLLDKVITELDGLYDPARQDDTPGTQKRV